jgi:hypothetical protein
LLPVELINFHGVGFGLFEDRFNTSIISTHQTNDYRFASLISFGSIAKFAKESSVKGRSHTSYQSGSAIYRLGTS